MATALATTAKRPSFESLASGIPDALRQRELGLLREGQTAALLDPMFAELPSILSSALRCDVEKLRKGLDLPPRKVSGEKPATDGDKEEQVRNLLLECVQRRRKEATLDVLLKALYGAHEETAIQKVAEGINNPDLQRAMPALTKVNLASVDGTFGSPSLQSHPQKDFVENEETQTGLPKPVDTIAASAGFNGQPENTSLELSPGVALPEPKKETSHDTKAMQHVPQGEGDLHSEELKQPMEESQLVPSEGHGGLMAATFEKPRLPTALVNAKYPDQRLERIESHVDALEQRMKRMDEDHQQSMKQMEKTMKEMDQKHQSESLKQLKMNEHLETKNEVLEAKLKKLQLSVLELEKELKEVNKRHKEALAKIAKLEEEKEELRKEKLQLESKNEVLEMKIADTEREKATIQGIKEDLEKRNIALQSELKQQKKNEEIQRMAHEQSAQAAKELFELELQEKSERIESLEKVAQSNEAQLKEKNRKLQEALDKIAKLEEDKKNMRREIVHIRSERVQSLEKMTQGQETQEMTDSHTGSGCQPRIICGNNSEKWTVEKSLGSGGYGEVLLAKKQDSGEYHAIKEISCEESTYYENQLEIMESFRKELETFKRCKHDRIVGYVDRFASSDKNVIYFYIVMDYMSQGSLADVLKNGKLSDLKAGKYTRQMLEGLSHLHANNIAHGDIKCANLLLDDNGDIKLADFGCAKFLESSANSDPGTLRWMAPERVPIEERECEQAKREQNKEGAKKSDIWSVGVTVLEMLTGKKPFHSYKLTEIVSALGERKLPLDDFIYAPEHSDEAKEFLRMCLMWEPSKRATLQDLLSSTFCSV